jgi:hypothetical protein
LDDSVNRTMSERKFIDSRQSIILIHSSEFFNNFHFLAVVDLTMSWSFVWPLWTRLYNRAHFTEVPCCLRTVSKVCDGIVHPLHLRPPTPPKIMPLHSALPRCTQQLIGLFKPAVRTLQQACLYRTQSTSMQQVPAYSCPQNKFEIRDCRNLSTHLHICWSWCCEHFRPGLKNIIIEF